MNFKRNLVCSFLGLLTLTVVVDAHAAYRSTNRSQNKVSTVYRSADDSVIYKIHDIKPVIEENKVVACDFGITFLNRTNSQVDNLSLDIQWTDKVLENKIAQEKAEVNHNGKKIGKSKTEQFASKNISTNIEVPHLPSKQQVSVKGKIFTDSCFLLADKPVIKARRCHFAKDKQDSSCNGLFYFISMQNDEYYSDFQEISYENRKKAEENKNIKAQKELNDSYSKSVINMQKAIDTLNSIQ